MSRALLMTWFGAAFLAFTIACEFRWSTLIFGFRWRDAAFSAIALGYLAYLVAT